MDGPLAYNSNLHPAEDLAAIADQVARFGGAVRQRLGWPRLGVDLRLGSRALAEAASQGVAGLRRACDGAGLQIDTLNLFPLQPFQNERVKEQVYRPDWSEDDRLQPTLTGIEVALALSDADLVTISTLPGSFKPWRPGTRQVAAMAARLGRWAAAAARAEAATGRRVVLCLEPEPWCLLERSHEVVAFWDGPVQEHAVPACVAALDDDHAAAQRAVARHIGWCADTCHISVAFEEQSVAIERLQACGAGVMKMQVSACPEVTDAADAGQVAALRRLDEPRFLHQTALRQADGVVRQVVDLDRLDALLVTAEAGDTVRSHFHIPLDREPADGLHSTRFDSLAGLAAAGAGGCRHVAVETYTWSILADDDGDRIAGTAGELAWLAERQPRPG